MNEAEKKLKLRFLELDLHVLNVNNNAVDLEEMMIILLVGSLQCTLEAQSSTSQEDVH